MALHLIPGQTLIAATHNAGKAKEISALLEGQFKVISAAEAGLIEPEETEMSFVGNAILKARLAALASGDVAMADDSGLSIAALNGDPGIYSARWAGPQRDFGRAMEIIQHKMRLAQAQNPETYSDTAHFTCALAVAWPQGHACVFEGIIHGQIVFPARGDSGFGYDPIFQPHGYDISFGQMMPEEKDALSHRALAFAQLKAALF
jgi:XTP/dITP diphosphohydrolase